MPQKGLGVEQGLCSGGSWFRNLRQVKGVRMLMGTDAFEFDSQQCLSSPKVCHTSLSTASQASPSTMGGSINPLRRFRGCKHRLIRYRTRKQNAVARYPFDVSKQAAVESSTTHAGGLEQWVDSFWAMVMITRGPIVKALSALFVSHPSPGKWLGARFLSGLSHGPSTTRPSL